MKDHYYNTITTWTGNTGSGTARVNSYERDLTLIVPGKPEIPGTSEVSIKGNRTRYNPEELLQCAVASCHMLTLLYLCAKNDIVVTAYVDRSVGTMQETLEGGGHFTKIVLKPELTIAGKIDESKMAELQHEANKLCYIASSCNFPIYHEPVYLVSET